MPLGLARVTLVTSGFCEPANREPANPRSSSPEVASPHRRCHHETGMLFTQRRPAPPLDRWIDAIWLCRSEPRPRALERVLPSGASQLILNLAEDETRIYSDSGDGVVCERSPGSVLTGMSTRFHVIDTDEQAYVAGVVFRAGGMVPFVRPPAHELSDADVPLEFLWGRQPVQCVRDQLLSARTPDAALDTLEAMLRQTWREKAAHPTVQYALSNFRAHPSVARVREVTDAIALSPKRFIERFKADVGVTPKRYCRILRFQRVVTRAHQCGPIDWTDLALDCGYFDQAHLIHEFREFSGLTPTGYEAQRTTFQNHVTFLQSAGG
jgi:AraC-like DNA-binding protein